MCGVDGEEGRETAQSLLLQQGLFHLGQGGGEGGGGEEGQDKEEKEKDGWVWWSHPGVVEKSWVHWRH